MPGTLFVVATPIGNLEDLTFRALGVLKTAALVAAEDTRRTARLLAHYEISKPLTSLREHNELREIPKLLDRLAQGASVALVTDAGTPGIADPGARLVRAARHAGFPVVPIPGPSAITAALSVAGFPADQFVFQGFPPSSGPSRDAWLAELGREPRLQIFFEAPHRIARTLIDVKAVLGERQIIVGRELTKLYEELVEWDKSSAPIKESGEFVVVIGPSGLARSGQTEDDQVKAAEMFGVLTENNLFDADVAAKMISGALGYPEESVRKLVKRGRIAMKRGR
jgi:16S rRNA (cytidine1402-2'-O)-methyltransferase